MSTIAIADIQRTAAPAVHVRLRLTRRGRIVFTTLAALPLLIVVAFFVLNGGQASAGDAAAGGARTQFDTVTIQPGETLWQLAEDTAPNADPRDFVQDVISLNALDGSGLQAGEQIAIPTKYTSGQ
ncbi:MULTISPECIES: LysM peptidoglycan-binding domain-containing protein [unclassified Curtobacterium]|uniref:LysM peptidoglycan-binding domain-containing protein n=1 Tax=unclassified Curtobacterium TaxID=257496 RepID=UPI000F4A26D6|nr:MULTISPECIES: LysM peptidoglycan-binding domain-containing protein [unclassified Curtobacterium]ROQ04132.1 LysM domain-containing protein [Curtobacterium sp. PhB171]ROQ19397.1 LysM domain-containing protein [Curtobacterium sp. PhB170]ROS32701.1 LysM domain-containing protein [Curtobacterium sp. PhB131]ROS64264.1 LysM domain-containing protein [Curtobacterium sp. PhB141]